MPITALSAEHQTAEAQQIILMACEVRDWTGNLRLAEDLVEALMTIEIHGGRRKPRSL